MKITGPRKLVERAEFAAEVLGLYNFSLEIDWAPEGGTSESIAYEDGTFKIHIQKGLPTFKLMSHVAHEMTHLRQYKTQRLYTNEHGRWWDGQWYPDYESDFCDAYFLSPWEMEARANEGWLDWKWENR